MTIMNIYKIFIAFLVLAMTSIGAEAQDSDWRTYNKKKDTKEDLTVVQTDTLKKELNFNQSNGNVVIIQDSKIDSMTSQIGRKPFINGYTVQIEVTQQKSIIRNSRYLFIRHYPDVPLDEEYDIPNTYLYGGRFYDKNSAYEFKHKIKKDFPNAIVIEKKMDLPPLKSE